jgi:hypothetical protein
VSEPPTLCFLGGTGAVTGSKYLVSADGHQVLLDRGLFRGPKELRQRNWAKPPFEAGLSCRHPQDHALDMKPLMHEKRRPLCCKQYHLAQ